MDLKFNLKYKELLDLIKQLPSRQIARLKVDLSDDLIKEQSNKESSELYKLLLEGPTMTKEQYDQFLSNRKHFDQWRVN